MASTPSSEATLQGSPVTQKKGLNLALLPPIFVSKTHLDTEDLHELEDAVVEAGGSLTYDLNEAKIILTKAKQKRRIQLDLRSQGCYTEEVVPLERSKSPEGVSQGLEPAAKRRKLSQQEGLEDGGEKTPSTKGRTTTIESNENTRTAPGTPMPQDLDHTNFPADLVKVLKIEWFEDSARQGTVLAMKPYLSYQGRRVGKPNGSTVSKRLPSSPANPSLRTPQAILERAKADASADSTSPSARSRGRRLGQIGGSKFASAAASGSTSKRHAHLLQQTTSEHDQKLTSELPEMPDWVKQDIKYACQRITLAHPPNEPFIDLLKKIKLARLLTNDEIGVRAYSTSIAALAAYQHKISKPLEVLALPGCDSKIANLYVEYANYGNIQEAEEAENNAELKVLRLFYDIWGVGATTAREFYYDHGWRDLDDVIEHGWSTLSRVQQIGVKYYQEFLTPIPRAEVDEIAATIRRHAVKVCDDGIQTLVVGGHRRGKDESGDVDVIVSHPDETKTLNIVNEIVGSLEEEGWVTHTLVLTLTSSNRNQQTLPFKVGSAGHGFDTLDKAMVVWQDPKWPSKDTDLAANPKARNPNIHRRVDIIISPWKTVGCAVMGWSGGTTFQRDLRRYVKNTRGWKFDSSGVRDRTTGQVIDVDGYSDEETRAKTMVEAEKRVFENLGLEWREPWERCTG